MRSRAGRAWARERRMRVARAARAHERDARGGSQSGAVVARARLWQAKREKRQAHRSLGDWQLNAEASDSSGASDGDENKKDTQATATTAQGRPIDYTLLPGEIAVRFINTPSGKDIVAAAKPGDNLMAVGDSVDLRIPRGCQTGLCGACTCELEDPEWAGGSQLIRACSTAVVLAKGSDEMVIDVSRMTTQKQRGRKDPFGRFENVDTAYVAGAAPKSLSGSGPCGYCKGTGQHSCPDCDGSGICAVDETYECQICMGGGVVRCAECQGVGARRSAN
ncbi:hypothetical protein FVE85_5851 [Porphyridium purpureum]|uniref:2Fe-2S ferredoxin-type domain-containing protein n=1 Tax=Porphyridium purpureum TaxID=35688 RepID=A0A5J4Z3Q4_PORPP|nr:hypothetical protein FVE85_5851 [Porphyridium purpureum]|eukprot:POR1351..scf295_1